MKVKTSELTGAALDWAVAKCEGISVHVSRGGWIVFDADAWPQFRNDYNDYKLQSFAPSTNWSTGGLIIEREQIALQYYQDGGHENGGEWLAYVLSGKDDDGFDNTIVTDGPTPLIAAMRCFVASKLGEEVEISEELA